MSSEVLRQERIGGAELMLACDIRLAAAEAISSRR